MILPRLLRMSGMPPMEANKTKRMLMLKKIKANYYKCMALPAFLLFFCFFIYPLCLGIGMSFTNWDGVSAEKTFVGLWNFREFFRDSRAIHTMLTTIKYGLLEPICINVVGLGLALFLDSKLKMTNLMRTFVYLPSVISALVMGYVWQLMLRPDGGAVRQVMEFLGFGAHFKAWLAYPDSALWIILLVNVWQFSGPAMVIYLAGLQSVPQELYEVATIDGAGYLQKLKCVTFPMLKPAFQINVITNIIGALSVHDSVVALTDGGPGYATETISVYIYRMSAGARAGYATAVAIILLLITMLPTIFIYRAMQKER